METKASAYLYGSIAAIILLLVIFFVGKSYGKNKPPTAIADPNDGNTIFDPTSYTDRLYTDINGLRLPIIHWFRDDSEIWKLVTSLSDSNLVKIMNDWDKRYYSKWKQTLATAVAAESFLTDQGLLTRLKRLEATRKK